MKKSSDMNEEGERSEQDEIEEYKSEVSTILLFILKKCVICVSIVLNVHFLVYFSGETVRRRN